MVEEVLFTRNHIRLSGTMLLPVDCDGDGVLPAEAVRDADPDGTPPEIRTASGVTVFVPARQRTELRHFCETNRVPLRSRYDVWGDLLEPFLDTEISEEHRVAAMDRLNGAGLDPARVAAVRAAVAPLVLAYNARHWDAHHLGLSDLLGAVTADWIPESRRMGPSERNSLCTWAMEIADLGHSRDA